MLSHQLITDGYATSANPLYSKIINTSKARTTSVQMIVRAADGASAVAKAFVQVSNNQTDWFNLAELDTTGTGHQTDGGPYEALWNYTRVQLYTTPARDVEGKGIVDVVLINRE